MTKLQKKIELRLSLAQSAIKSLLLSGDLLSSETLLSEVLDEIYVDMMEASLNEVGSSIAFKSELLQHYEASDVSDLRLRETRIQLKNGKWVNYKSYYARHVKEEHLLPTRHLSQCYWSCIDRASPAYVGLLSAYGVVSISFGVGKDLLKQHGIAVNKSRMRSLSLALGELAQQQTATCMLSSGETLAGERVVIELDGGRTRMRVPNGEYSAKNRQKYDTPWNEPKIIVIEVLDEKGRIKRKERLPLYLGTMQDIHGAMRQLKEVLTALNINQAKSIQVVADGARCIWSGIRQLLSDMKVSFSKVVFTLDYYHAVEHLKELSEYLPYSEKKQKSVFEQWKNDLWQGQVKSIVKHFKDLMGGAKKQLTQEMQTALEYFTKHHDKMQYKKFKRRKLLCGSGLVESTVRRVINLRFKSASSFWSKPNLEKLIMLRCAFLASRWHNLLNNSILHVKKMGTI